MAAKRRRAKRLEQYKTPAYRDLQARLSQNILRLREARGWTQEVAAWECKMPVRVLQQIEHAEVNLTLTTLARLVAGFGVDVRKLLAPAERV